MSKPTSNISIRVKLPEENTQQLMAQEEITILWDRVIAAILLISLFVGLTLMGLQYWRSMENLETPIQLEKPQPLSHPDVSVERLKTTKPSPVPHKHVEPNSKANPDSPVPITHTNTIAKDPASTKQPTTRATPAAIVLNEQTGTIAPVKIHSEKILQARLTTELENRSPVSDAPSTLAVDAEKLLTVYFFTEISGYRATPIFFNWYQDKKRVARVRVRPLNDTTQILSSKYINHQMTGDWRVELVSQAGETLAESQFTIVANENL